MKKLIGISMMLLLTAMIFSQASVAEDPYPNVSDHATMMDKDGDLGGGSGGPGGPGPSWWCIQCGGYCHQLWRNGIYLLEDVNNWMVDGLSYGLCILTWREGMQEPYQYYTMQIYMSKNAYNAIQWHGHEPCWSFTYEYPEKEDGVCIGIPFVCRYGYYPCE